MVSSLAVVVFVVFVIFVGVVVVAVVVPMASCLHTCVAFEFLVCIYTVIRIDLWFRPDEVKTDVKQTIDETVAVLQVRNGFTCHFSGG